jgi:hypothetical protein
MIELGTEKPTLETRARLLNFAHIEKTAGTSLRSLLADHFDHWEVFSRSFKSLSMNCLGSGPPEISEC